jgi:hypothetical protein
MPIGIGTKPLVEVQAGLRKNVYEERKKRGRHPTRRAGPNKRLLPMKGRITDPVLMENPSLLQPGTKKKNGNGKTVTVTPPKPPTQPMNLLGAIFPPLGLKQQTEYLQKLQEFRSTPPTITFEGLTGEEALQLKDKFKRTTPQPQQEPFGGALEGLGRGIKLAGYLVPIGLGVMLLSQIKGLFK